MSRIKLLKDIVDDMHALAIALAHWHRLSRATSLKFGAKQNLNSACPMSEPFSPKSRKQVSPRRLRH